MSRQSTATGLQIYKIFCLFSKCFPCIILSAKIGLIVDFPRWNPYWVLLISMTCLSLSSTSHLNYYTTVCKYLWNNTTSTSLVFGSWLWTDVLSGTIYWRLFQHGYSFLSTIFDQLEATTMKAMLTISRSAKSEPTNNRDHLLAFLPAWLHCYSSCWVSSCWLSNWPLPWHALCTVYYSLGSRQYLADKLH